MMNRKSFITVCGTGALTAFMASCGKVYYATNTTTANRTILVDLKEFEYVEKDVAMKRPFILVQSEQLDLPIAVYRTDDGKYNAIYTKCSHTGCEVRPAPTVLQCPCHGSEFSTAGKVLSPPADKDLLKFAVSVHNNQLVIDLNTPL